jgi:hypothetical protein
MELESDGLDLDLDAAPSQRAPAVHGYVVPQVEFEFKAHKVGA